MNEAKAMLLVIKGAISELPEQEQAKVKELADKVRAIIKEDEKLGTVAFSLVGCELNAED